MKLRSKRAVRFAIPALVACSLVVLGTSTAGATRPASGQSEHDRIVAFWTNARVARAIPRDFVFDPKTKTFQKAAPTGSSTTNLGSSWTAGGAVLKTTGKVLFAMGGSYWVCSASVVKDTVSGRSIILTAGHCAYDETGHAFATNWMFVPSYDTAPAPLTASGSFCANTTYGCWTASALVVDNGFATAGSFNNQAVVNDFAFAVVGKGGKSGTADLDTTVGAQSVQFSAAPSGSDTYLFGYPAAGKYKGNDLVYCRGPLGFDSNISNATYRVACNMTGGSSGGPWFSAFSSGSGTIISLNSYGYSGVTAMFGPKLDANTASLFNVAGTATANTIVP
jgi:hypothetical protein